jgi:hypothetical protein
MIKYQISTSGVLIPNNRLGRWADVGDMRERGRMPHSQGQGFCDLPLAVGMGNPFYSLPPTNYAIGHFICRLQLVLWVVGWSVTCQLQHIRGA